MEITPDMTVRQTIQRFPQATRIFEIHRVPACCTARSTIAAAAARYGVDADALVRMLNRAVANGEWIAA